MKCKILQKDNYVLTGRNVLRMIMDDETPGIDLLVRESLQNCLDAISDDKNHGIVNYIYNSFEPKSLVSTFDDKLVETTPSKIETSDFGSKEL